MTKQEIMESAIETVNLRGLEISIDQSSHLKPFSASNNDWEIA